MSKNLKATIILYGILALCVIAFKSISSYFGGVGAVFAILMGVYSSCIILTCVSNRPKRRTLDLLILGGVFLFFEFLVYFIIEFQIGSLNTYKAFMNIQNVLSFLAILMFAYVVFRFIYEHNDMRLPFMKVILSGRDYKQSKGLEQKPIAIKTFVQDDEEEIEIPSVSIDDAETESAIMEELETGREAESDENGESHLEDKASEQQTDAQGENAQGGENSEN